MTTKKAETETLHDALTSESFNAELRACKSEAEKGALHALICEKFGVTPGAATKRASGGKKRSTH